MSPATPFFPGQEWIWTLVDGFSEPRSIAFQPQPNGWEVMRTKRIEHPADILKYSDLRAQFDELVGLKGNDIIDIIAGPGSGEFKGDVYSGSACRAHSCQDASVFVVTHGPSKKIYLAWKLENQAIVFRPPLAEWPQIAQAGLNAWRKKYETKSPPPAKGSLKPLSPL